MFVSPSAASRIPWIACFAAALLAAGAIAQETPEPTTQPSDTIASAEQRLSEARDRWEASRGQVDEQTANARARISDLQALSTRPSTSQPKRLQAELTLLNDRLAYLQALRDANEREVALLSELVGVLKEHQGLGLDDPAASGLRVPQTETDARLFLMEMHQRKAELTALQDQTTAIERESELRRKELALAEQRLAQARSAAEQAGGDTEGSRLLQQRSTLESNRKALAEQLIALTSLKEEVRTAKASLLNDQLALRRRVLADADPQLVESTRTAIAAPASAPAAESEDLEQRRKELAGDQAQAERRVEQAQEALKEAKPADAAKQQRAQLELENARRAKQIAQLELDLLAAQRERSQHRTKRAADIRELTAFRQQVRGGQTTPADLRDRLDLSRLEIDNLESQQKALTANRDAARERARLSDSTVRAAEQARQAVDASDPLAALLDESIAQLQELRRLDRELAAVLDEQIGLVADNIDDHRRLLEDTRIRTTYWGSTIRQWSIAVAWLALALLACLLTGMLVRRVIRPLADRTEQKLDDYVIRRLHLPARLGLVVLGLYLAVKTLVLPAAWEQPAGRLLADVIILTVTLLVMRTVDVLAALLEAFVRKTEQRQMAQLLPFLRRLTRFVVAIIGLCMVLSAHDYSVASIIAGLGIGGLAFALAAQDTLGNVFGSAMIFGDQPFAIGDWIRYDGQEGIVEAIGLRSTRIRTWEDTLITVPNRDIAAKAIENVSRFKARRVKIFVGITYEAEAEGAEKAVKIIREILDSNERVRPGHYIYFTDFGDSALMIMVYYFVLFTDWRTYLETRQTVNLEILRRFKQAGLSIAYPTRMLHFYGRPPGEQAGRQMPSSDPPSTSPEDRL